MDFFLDSEKSIKYLLQALFRNSYAVIFDGNLHFLGLSEVTDYYFNLSTNGCVFNSIRQKIDILRVRLIPGLCLRAGFRWARRLLPSQSVCLWPL